MCCVCIIGYTGYFCEVVYGILIGYEIMRGCKWALDSLGKEQVNKQCRVQVQHVTPESPPRRMGSGERMSHVDRTDR